MSKSLLNNMMSYEPKNSVTNRDKKIISEKVTFEEIIDRLICGLPNPKIFFNNSLRNYLNEINIKLHNWRISPFMHMNEIRLMVYKFIYVKCELKKSNGLGKNIIYVIHELEHSELQRTGLIYYQRSHHLVKSRINYVNTPPFNDNGLNSRTLETLAGVKLSLLNYIYDVSNEHFKEVELEGVVPVYKKSLDKLRRDRLDAMRFTGIFLEHFPDKVPECLLAPHVRFNLIELDGTFITIDHSHHFSIMALCVIASEPQLLKQYAENGFTVVPMSVPTSHSLNLKPTYRKFSIGVYNALRFNQ